jgi:hypothetical protein
MPDPRNVAHDKRVQQEKKHHGGEVGPDANETHRPGMKPHQHAPAEGHGPDPDEPVDKTESGEEP